MLKISTDTLPQTCLSYLAFRLAFLETLDRIALWRRHERDLDDLFGYLGEVPFLRETAPQVQLDLLAATWTRHVDVAAYEANLIDESVIYAVCETSARLVEQDPATVKGYLRGGPLDVHATVDHQLAAELRALHLNLANEGDFLLIGQFLDMPPEESDVMKRQFRIQPEQYDVMFDALGQWCVSGGFLRNLRGLLTDAEIQRIPSVLPIACPA